MEPLDNFSSSGSGSSERYVTARDDTKFSIVDPIGSDGWPLVGEGTPAADTDQDGMPNAWEHAYELNTHDDSNGTQDAYNDGYTNIEEFINGTNPRPESWSPSDDTTPSTAPQSLQGVALP